MGQAALHVRQGATFRVTFANQDGGGLAVPLTGLRARFQVGQRGARTLVDLDSATAAGLVVREVAGEIDVELGATVTKALPAGRFEYDLDLYDPANPDEVEPFVSGAFAVLPEVLP